MRVAKLVAPNRIEVVQEAFTPAPAPGEVVVQVKAVGICGTDMHIFKGHRADVALPRVMGHELSGIVSQAGAGADFAPGDAVILDPVFACGSCPTCRKGHENVCASVCCFGVQMDGGFQDYITVPAHRLYKFPTSVSMAEAALAEPFSIAANITARTGMAAGENAVVIGAGTIGLTLVQVLAAVGVNVLAADMAPAKLALAQSFGAKHVINSGEENLVEAVEKHFPGGADIVIDAVGITPLTQQSIDLAAPVARIAIIGFDDTPLAIPPVLVTKKELTLVGSRMNNGRFPQVVEWLQQGSIRPAEMISARYPLEEIQTAFERTIASPDTHVKTIIEF